MYVYMYVLISRESGKQRVAEIMHEYIVVFQVFVSLCFLRTHRYLATTSLESSYSEYLIKRTCSLMFWNAETQRATSVTRLDMLTKVCFKYLIYILPEI